MKVTHRLLCIWTGVVITNIELPAAPISYTINFVQGNGASITPTGGFSYDASASLSSRFSNFTVNWNGIAFDLTAAANSPVVFGSDFPNSCFSTADSAGAFQALSNPAGCRDGGVSGWIGQTNDTDDKFTWYLVARLPSSSTLFLQANIFPGSGLPPPATVFSSGSWVLVPVPEPCTLALLSIAFVVFVGWRGILSH